MVPAAVGAPAPGAARARLARAARRLRAARAVDAAAGPARVSKLYWRKVMRTYKCGLMTVH